VTVATDFEKEVKFRQKEIGTVLPPGQQEQRFILENDAGIGKNIGAALLQP
jgi:hypothetical protein